MAERMNYQRVATVLYRSLERLSLAIEGCAKIGFQESSPTTNTHHASVWNDLNEAQKDAKLKLKHLRWPSAAVSSSQGSGTCESTSDRNEESDARVIENYNDSTEDVDRFNRKTGGGVW